MQDKGGLRGAFCMPHHTDAGVLAFRWGRLAAEVPATLQAPSVPAAVAIGKARSSSACKLVLLLPHCVVHHHHFCVCPCLPACLPACPSACAQTVRRWLDAAGPVPYKGGQALGPILPRQQVLEHFESHVRRCPACKQGLRELRKKQTAALMGGAHVFDTLPAGYCCPPEQAGQQHTHTSIRVHTLPGRLLPTVLQSSKSLVLVAGGVAAGADYPCMMAL